jgi:hypothetical protein
VDGIPVDAYRSAAPLTGAATSFGVFNGIDPNGTWRLRVIDQFPDTVPDPGQSLQGWSLDLAVTAIPEPGTAALMATSLVLAALLRRR